MQLSHDSGHASVLQIADSAEPKKCSFLSPDKPPGGRCGSRNETMGMYDALKRANLSQIQWKLSTWPSSEEY